MKRKNFIFWIISCSMVACGCDLGDVCGLDDDGDGFTNCDDVCSNHYDTNFIDHKQFKEKGCTDCVDSDKDGIINCLDLCPDDKDREWGDCGCVDPIPGTEGLYLTCPDTEGLEDLCPNDPMKTEPGVCGCGVSDRLIVWDDDSLTQGNPRSECPISGAIDLCPFDDEKTEPGQCGCGVPDTDSDNDSIADCLDECPQDAGKRIPGLCGCGLPDTDTDNDGIIDCKDLCPEDPEKKAPGVCGCGVEDSVANLKDTDNDGVVDCQDKCPENPYKIAPDPTTCDDWDSDGDGVEDPQDVCPYNPNLSKPNADGSKPDCNYVTDSEGNSVFEIWDAQDLTRLMDELETKVIPEGRPGMMCNPSMAPTCVGEYDGPRIPSTNPRIRQYILGKDYVACRQDPKLGIGILEIEHCARGCGYWKEPGPGTVSSYLKACFVGAYNHTTYDTYVNRCKNSEPYSWFICTDSDDAFDCENYMTVPCIDGCSTGSDDEHNYCDVCDTEEYTQDGYEGGCCDAAKYTPSCDSDQLLRCNARGVIYAEGCEHSCVNEKHGARCKYCENEIGTGGATGDCCHPDLYGETCIDKDTALVCNDGGVEKSDCIGGCYSKGENKVFCIPKEEDTQIFNIELKHDINLSTVIPTSFNQIGCTGEWDSIDLYHTRLNGNNHTITFTADYGNERCALSRPFFESVLESEVKDLNVDVDFRGEFNGALIGFSNRSVFNNVGWHGSVVLETSIYGKQTLGEVCTPVSHFRSSGHVSITYYTGVCRQTFGGFAGFASDSIFNDIRVGGNIVSFFNNYDIAGVIGIGENIVLKGIDGNLDSMYARNALLNDSIEAANQLPSSVSSLIVYPFGDVSFSDADIKIQSINANTYCDIAKNLSKLSLNSIDLSINELKADKVASPICSPEMGIYSHSMDVSKELSWSHLYKYFITREKSLKIDKMHININKVKTNTLSPLQFICNDHKDKNDCTEDVIFNDLEYNYKSVEANEYTALYLDNENITASHIIINTESMNVSKFTGMMSYNFEYQIHFSDIFFKVPHTITEYFELARLQVVDTDRILFDFDSIQSDQVTLLDLTGGNHQNWYIYINNLERSWVIDSYFNRLKKSNGRDVNMKNVFYLLSGKGDSLDYTYDEDGEKIYDDDGNPVYQTVSTGHFYGPLISPFYESSSVFYSDSIHDFYWFKYYDSDYAFGQDGSPDPNDDGTVFIPFNVSQTDAVVSKLGEGWTKKKVTYHDVEQDKDVEIEIPWLKTE